MSRYAAPPRNRQATTALSTWCGSRVSSWPAVTAMATCRVGAAAAPANPGSRRYRVLSTSDANRLLSGSSARKMIPNTVATTARTCTAGSSGARHPAGAEGSVRPRDACGRRSRPPDDSTGLAAGHAGRAGVSTSQRGTTPLLSSLYLPGVPRVPERGGKGRGPPRRRVAITERASWETGPMGGVQPPGEQPAGKRAAGAVPSGTTAWPRGLDTPLRQFLRTETGSAAVLLAAALAGLVGV